MNTPQSPRWIAPSLALCMLVSGACGLVYQVAWARMLGVFLGASAYAHAVVLAAFLGGLALGNTWIGRWVDRRPAKALLIYAGLELVIGLYGLLSPELRLGVQNLYLTLAGDAPPGGALAGAKMVCAAGFILVPTIAMGGTLPALIRHVVASLDELGVAVARFYWVNTVGAAAGAFACGMWWIPSFGVVPVVRWAGIVNLAIAAVALAMHLHIRAPLDDETPRRAPVRLDPSQRWILGAAFMMGVATLTMEIAWTRMLAMVFGSSAQAFTLMLTTFIAGIAVGTLCVPTLLRKFAGREVTLLAVALLCAATLLVLQIPLYERLPYWQFGIAHALERRPHVYPVYLASQASLAFLWMFPLTVVSGATLPIATHVVSTRFEDVGRSVGGLFTANTIGNVIGPLLATFVWLPVLGLRHTVTVGVFGLIVAAVFATRASAAPQVGRRVVIAGVVLALFATLLPRWDAGLLHAGGFRRWTLEPGASYRTFRETRARSQVLWSRDGAADSVVVLENRDGLRFMKVNGKTDASDAEDLPTQRMVAHLPLLLYRAWHETPPADVFVVGLGSGVTVGSAAMHEGVHVTSAELSEGVIRGSAFFDHVNHDARNRDNVTLHAADAREWLERSPQRWDVIINQPSNPWIAGNAALFSREFFEAAHHRLEDDGIFAQWMHVYAMDDETVEIVMNTFASVFPHVTIWWPQGVDLLLIGSNTPPSYDLAALDEALGQPWLQEQMQGYDREGLRVTNLRRLLALQIASNAQFRAEFDGAQPHTTDLRPRLEFRAPLAQFVGDRSELFVALDERMKPGDDTALQWGRLPPPTLDEMVDLAAFFAGRDTPFSERLTGSLTHATWDGTAADFTDYTTRATGLPAMFEAWTEALLSADSPAPADCRAYLETAQSSLPVRASAFYRPPLYDVEEIVTRCGETTPAAATFLRAMFAEVQQRCGYQNEAEATARAVLAMPHTAVVDEAMQAILAPSE